jgi:hypothetical protein
VRPDDRIPAKDAEVFRMTAMACRQAGWEFRRTGTIDPVVRANVRWLSRYGWMLLCQWWGLAADVAVTVAVSSAQVVRWQADPDHRATRPGTGSGGAVFDLAVNRSFVDVALTQGLRFEV